MSDPINITAIYDINTGRDRIEITDAIAAEIVRRGLAHSRHGLPITPQTITMPPTKPPANQCQGEDAAGQYLYNLMTQKLALGHDTADRAADAIISAIRRGEVPGIYAVENIRGTLVKDLEAERERDAARAEVAALKARKAKLPAKTPDDLMHSALDMWRNDVIDACAEAIRAAGVEAA